MTPLQSGWYNGALQDGRFAFDVPEDTPSLCRGQRTLHVRESLPFVSKDVDGTDLLWTGACVTTLRPCVAFSRKLRGRADARLRDGVASVEAAQSSGTDSCSSRLCRQFYRQGDSGRNRTRRVPVP